MVFSHTMSPVFSASPEAPRAAMPALPSATASALAESIAAAGAVITLAGVPPRHYLIGYLAWVGPQRLFWFTAHGDTTEDGRVLEFHEASAPSPDRILFYRDGQLAATLSAIPTAPVDDPDDYLIAWQLWHGVSPRRQPLIRAALARFLDSEADAAPSD